MRKIVTAVMGTISGLVLLFSYHTSTNSEAAGTTAEDQGTPPETSSAGTTPSSAATTAPSSSSTASSSAGSSSTAASSASGTYTGDAVETRWGTVQVQITVKDGKITAAEAVQYPNENPKDQQINAYAVPQLNSEAVAAQSASIDAVSGATVTSDGYIESLQSAIDAAHLA
jgi:uncharacterized protein with FMN-binding domain